MSSEGQTNLTQLLEAVVQAAAEDIRVCMPAVVTSVDLNSATLSARPAIKKQGAQDFDPVVSGIPIWFPRSSKGGTTFPIDVKDDVILVFGDRSLEAWLRGDGGSEVEPEDARTHDITDAFAIPGSLSKVPSNRTDGLNMFSEGTRNETGEVYFDADAKVGIGKKRASGTVEGNPWTGKVELLGLIKELVILIKAIPGAAQNPLTNLEDRLELIKGDL